MKSSRREGQPLNTNITISTDVMCKKALRKNYPRYKGKDEGKRRPGVGEIGVTKRKLLILLCFRNDFM